MAYGGLDYKSATYQGRVKKPQQEAEKALKDQAPVQPKPPLPDPWEERTKQEAGS